MVQPQPPYRYVGGAAPIQAPNCLCAGKRSTCQQTWQASVDPSPAQGAGLGEERTRNGISVSQRKVPVLMAFRICFNLLQP